MRSSPGFSDQWRCFPCKDLSVRSSDDPPETPSSLSPAMAPLEKPVSHLFFAIRQTIASVWPATLLSARLPISQELCSAAGSGHGAIAPGFPASAHPPSPPSSTSLPQGSHRKRLY